MEEKVKVIIELDKQYIRDVMLAVGLTAADPGKANKVMESIGEEITVDMSVVSESQADEAQIKVAFAIAAVATAIKQTETPKD